MNHFLEESFEDLDESLELEEDSSDDVELESLESEEVELELEDETDFFRFFLEFLLFLAFFNLEEIFEDLWRDNLGEGFFREIRIFLLELESDVSDFGLPRYISWYLSFFQELFLDSSIRSDFRSLILFSLSS